MVISYLRMLVEMFNLNLHVYEPVLEVERDGNGFVLHTRPLAGDRRYRCRRLALTTGGMARPRLLATGFVADTTLFEKAGVRLQGIERAPVYDPRTMETNVPGLYVAGTASAGTQQRFTLSIVN